MPAEPSGVRRNLWFLALVGVGLVSAPAIFQMFSRAPLGGEMIDEFRPFMSTQRLTAFSAHLKTIEAAHTEVAGSASLGPEEIDANYPQVAGFQRSWPVINKEMTQMLTRIEANLDNFDAVDALPPFGLFPWFFVLPGLLVAGLAVSSLASVRRGGVPRGRLLALAAVGAAIVAAPAAFQMFTRAPLGGDMIDDFRSLMTERRITDVQRYFLVIGGFEGEFRTAIAPAIDAESSRRGGFVSQFPQTAGFLDEWPQIAADLAPMVGVMADNLDNFKAVAALPPFDLFPWFFVAPGLLVAVTALLTARTLVAPVVGPVLEAGRV